jgi:glycosyltransferase involved in cell wall biosynthesis
MKVIYITYPYYFDASIGLIQEISRNVELHVILEVSPESQISTLLDLSGAPLQPGIMPADPILANLLPKEVGKFWHHAASFDLFVHTQKRSIHPQTLVAGRRLSEYIKSKQPDLIFWEDVSLRTALASLCFPKIPTVVGVHDPEYHPGEFNWRKVAARKIIYTQAGGFVLHNATQKEEFCRSYKIGPQKVDSIPLGPYEIYRSWAGNTGNKPTNHILFFGRFSPYKGIEVLMRAAPLICREIPNATFILAGKPIKGYRLPALPVLPNGGKFEIFQNYCPNEQLASLFQNCSCVVCPYIQATQSGVILTSYAFNKPVVASSTGGISEYVLDNETGFLVEPGDPISLKKAIVEIMRNPALREHFGVGISSFLRSKLNWKDISNMYLQTFNKILDRYEA